MTGKLPSDHCTVLVDATCAEFGGIATYAMNLLRTWARIYPQDEVHVLCPPEVANQVHGPRLIMHEIPIPRPVAIGRPWVQTRELRRLVRKIEPDAVLATLPSTTVRHPGAPILVVVYDLRHELRPKQFSRKQRLLRLVSYGRGYAVADGFISISARSLRDLHRLHPATRSKRGDVVHLGADHVAQWPGLERGNYALAFAHHTNKKVDLVLDAWQTLAEGGTLPGGVPVLRIAGVAPKTRAAIDAELRARGIQHLVELLPFLVEAEFQRLFAGAGAIVLPSDFEGFGLPVVEGMRLGKPVVVGPDDAVLEIAGGYASVMADWTAEGLANAVQAAMAMTPQQLRAAQAHAAEFTWERTTRQTRAALLAAASRSRLSPL